MDLDAMIVRVRNDDLLIESDAKSMRSVKVPDGMSELSKLAPKHLKEFIFTCSHQVLNVLTLQSSKSRIVCLLIFRDR